jgi:hypothetical protein
MFHLEKVSEIAVKINPPYRGMPITDFRKRLPRIANRLGSRPLHES